MASAFPRDAILNGRIIYVYARRIPSVGARTPYYIGLSSGRKKIIMLFINSFEMIIIILYAFT